MQRPVTFSADAARSLGGPAWSVKRRLEALERFEASPSPGADEDLWRYGRISELDLDQYAPSGTKASLGPAPEVGGWPQCAGLLEHVGELPVSPSSSMGSR